MKKLAIFAFLIIGLLATSGAAAQELSGDLDIAGSSTVFPVMQEAQQRWQEIHPDVEISVASVGSGGGFDRLSEGTTDLAPMSRAPKDDELSSVSFTVEKERIGLDALTVITNTDNPISQIDYETTQAIFNGTYTDWTEAFPEENFDSFTSTEIIVYERDENSGTHDYFNEEILNEGDAEADGQYTNQADLNGAVSETQNAIGYSGLAYVDSSVTALDYKGEGDSDYVTPTIASAADESYSLARPLFVVWNGDEDNEIRDEFVDYLLSPEGQFAVEKVGYVPIKDDVATGYTAVETPLPILPILTSFSILGIAVRLGRKQ